MSLSYFEKLTAEVIRLAPEYIKNPEDIQWNKGNGVFLCIESDGAIRGHVFGDNKEIQHKCYEIGVRKLLQVWRTGYHTGHFEQLVYAGKLDEGKFGVQKPRLIGWEGGVPLLTPEKKLIAAAFSGFTGTSDIAIIERAAVAVGLSTVPRA
jgi:glc operon protein GlcG